MIKIDKNIPLPGAHDETKTALSRLNVGDSFFVPNLSISGRTTMYRLAKQFDVKLVTRSVDGGIRIWRLA
jgi:hypothetical protein